MFKNGEPKIHLWCDVGPRVLKAVWIRHRHNVKI